jgi:predicted nucleic acid-binding protein
VALILDTSAVIGWVELKDAAIIEALRNHSADGSPRVHAVTIGELERGVAQAADEVSRARRGATLRFAREQLAPLPLDPDGDQSEAFGQVASALSREISHNDTWIVAAAVSERRHLLTQDAALAAKAAKAATTPGPFATWLDSHRYSLNIVHVPRRSA